MRIRFTYLAVTTLLAACGDDSAPGSAQDAAPDAADTAADSAAPPDAADSEVALDAEAPADTSDTGSPADTTTPPDAATPTDAASDTAAPADAADSTAPADTTPEDTAAPLDTTDSADTTPGEPPCPVIDVSEGVSFSPPLTLHLSGLSTTGSVSRWVWTLVSGPAGLASAFSPSAHSPTPTFEASLAGTYVFKLEAYDAAGRMACDAAEATLLAKPTSPVHLELVWDDNLPNPAAPVGADLDLHVLHPLAAGLSVDGDNTPDGWFDGLYDCAWHNPDATWPAPEGTPATRCRLLRRDDAGYGPEVIALEGLVPDLTYTAGFHIWSDDDTGYLQPTELRIWIDGVLKNKPRFDTPLHANDLWKVMTFRYPSGLLGFPFEDDGSFLPTSPTK